MISTCGRKEEAIEVRRVTSEWGEQQLLGVMKNSGGKENNSDVTIGEKELVEVEDNVRWEWSARGRELPLLEQSIKLPSGPPHISFMRVDPGRMRVLEVKGEVRGGGRKEGGKGEIDKREEEGWQETVERMGSAGV